MPEREPFSAACGEVYNPVYAPRIECDRPTGHEGQHEAVPFDVAWGPEEPTGKWVGDRWVRNAD